MADAKSGRNPAFSRRGALISFAGLAAVPLLRGTGHAQTYDDPPPFRTDRSQFTLLRPARDLAPVTLTDLNGRPAPLAPVPGKVLLIDFWATWCEACRLDLPLLERFHKAVGGRVELAAVATDTADRQRVKDYLAKLSIRDLPIYLDPQGRLAGNSAESPAPLKLYGMPVTYLITPPGRIAGYIAGVADWLSEDAQRLLAYYASA